MKTSCFDTTYCFGFLLLAIHLTLVDGVDDGCKSERNNYLDSACKHFHRSKRAGTRNTRQVFSDDVENPRHVVDRSESDKNGFRSPQQRLPPGLEPLYNRHTDPTASPDNEYAQYRSPRLDQRLWPGGEVFYIIDPTMSSAQRCVIYIAMDEIEFASDGSVMFKCAGKDAKIFVKFLLNNDDDFCYSKNVGRYLLNNEVRLSPSSCFNKMTVVHELMHVLGFFHEQVRYDRDEYITVNKSKVDKIGLIKQFNVGGSIFNQQVDNVGYDYESVMHYPDEGLLEAKQAPIEENTKRMGWYFLYGDGLSPKDKIKLKNLYQGISKDDKLLIASDKNWLNQPPQTVDVQLLENTGKSYSEDELIEKVKEMYAIAKDIAAATNQTEWLYQRLVDAALTQLTYDQHMLVMVGDGFDQSWDKVPGNTVPINNRENYEATEIERTNFVLDGKVEVMVVAQRRPNYVADMNPPCHCQPSETTTQQTWKSSAPTQPKLVDIQQKLDAYDGVKDWSSLATKPNTVVYDSYFERCICWHEIYDPIRFWEPPKRVYTWRALYGFIVPPYSPQQPNAPNQPLPEQHVPNIFQYPVQAICEVDREGNCHTVGFTLGLQGAEGDATSPPLNTGPFDNTFTYGSTYGSTYGNTPYGSTVPYGTTPFG